MTDETFSVFAALGALAAAGTLWFQFRRGQSMRRLIRSIEEHQWAPILLAHVAEKLETAQRLLAGAGGNNRRKGRKLREAHLAASEAGQVLATLLAKRPEEPIAALEEDVRALVALLEPLTETVTDEQIRVALDLVERVRGNLAAAPP